jgi:hypothetical protein
MKKIFLMFIFIINLFANSLETDLIGAHLDYKEYDSSNHIIDSDKSKFYEMKGIKVKYRGNCLLKYFLNLEFLYGQTIYSGRTMDGTPLYTKQKNVYILNLSSGIFLVNNFYLSLGYRKWNRGKSNYIGDYDEVYKWKYIGYGYEYYIDSPKLLVLMNLEYQKAFDASLNAYIGNGINLDLNDVYGWKIATNFMYN